MRVLGILICLSFVGCATAPSTLPALSYDARDLTPVARTQASTKEKSYVSVDLSVKVFEKIRQELERSEKVNLKTRGEAHITLITPPELQKLRKHLSWNDIEQVMTQTRVETAPYKLLCVGKGSVKNMSTYFVVVQAEAYYKFRKVLQDEFTKRGGKLNDFNADVFYPHVTVGFTQRDLHFEEGVIKDASSCIYSLHEN